MNSPFVMKIEQVLYVDMAVKASFHETGFESTVYGGVEPVECAHHRRTLFEHRLIM